MRCLESGTPGLRPRRIAPAVRSLAISDPHGFLIRTAAEVEKEEKRARRPGIDRTRSAEAESARALSEIRAAVNALPKDRREILGLHLEGLTYRQIAQQTALAKEAVLCDLVSFAWRWIIQDERRESEIGATGAGETRDHGD